MPARRRPSAIIEALALLAVAAALLVLSPVARSEAAGQFAVEGRVTDAATGGPLEGILVQALYLDDEGYCCTPLAETRTGLDGRYRLEGLDGRGFFGPYVRFLDDRDVDLRHLPETWPGVRSDDPLAGTPLEDDDDGVVEGIDAAMVTGGAVAGRLTLDGSGAPATDVPVLLTQGVNRLGPSTRTAADGTYRLTPVVGGTYAVIVGDESQVSEEPTVVAEAVTDRSRRAAADPVTVVEGAERVIDAQVAPAATLTGTVQVAPEVVGTVAARCVFSDADLLEAVEDHQPPVVQVGEDGRWRLPGLPAGTVRLRIDACDSSPTEEPGPFAAPVDLEPVEVATGATVDVGTTVLPAGGEIRGTLRVPEGEPASSSCAVAVGPDGTRVRRAGMLQDGTYRLTGLPTGVPLRVRGGGDCFSFSPGTSQPASRYAGGDGSFVGAEVLAVEAGEVVDGVDVRLAEGVDVVLDIAVQDAGATPPRPLVAPTATYSFEIRELCATTTTGDPAQPVDRLTYFSVVPNPGARLIGLPATGSAVEVASCGVGSTMSVAPTTAAYDSRPGTEVVVPVVVDDRLDRLAGASRIETAARIAAVGFPSAPAVVVARADAYPDALARRWQGCRAGRCS